MTRRLWAGQSFSEIFCEILLVSGFRLRFDGKSVSLLLRDESRFWGIGFLFSLVSSGSTLKVNLSSVRLKSRNSFCILRLGGLYELKCFQSAR